MPNTTSSTVGVVTWGGIRFIHNWGTANTFLGPNAGNFTMTGSGENVGIGPNALSANTTGASNTAIGTFALQANTGSNFNTAVGRATLLVSTGSSNTAVGAYALDANTTGTLNIAMGQDALGNNSSGSNNIAIGTLSGNNATTGSNNIIIGNAGVAAEGSTTRIGTGGTQTRAFIAGISGVTTGGTGAAVMIDSNGQLGTISSSQRFKYDVQDMGSASNRLLQLRPVMFRYKQAQNDGSHPLQYGLIAEEVARVYPELVQFAPTGEVNTVLYHLLPAMLLNEAQKQNAEIAALNTEITTLRRQVEQLKEEQTEIRQLRADVERLKASGKSRPAALVTTVLALP